jgi:hypothetical protein
MDNIGAICVYGNSLESAYPTVLCDRLGEGSNVLYHTAEHDGSNKDLITQDAAMCKLAQGFGGVSGC